MTKRIFTLLIIWNLVIMSGFSADLNNLFPLKGELKNWKISDSVKVYKGDELYNYIDGGAEVFMEYGFKQVASASYLDKNNNQLQVEVYEMSDSAAACGAYTFYLNGKGKVLKEVPNGIFLDYYAVFCKSNMLSVISLATPNDSLISSLESLAKYISSKIPQTSSAPALVSGFANNGMVDGYIKFFKGNVGLGNFYKFIPGDAFKFLEGIGFSLSGTKVIIIKYGNDLLASSSLDETLKKMQEKNKETSFIKLNSGFSFSDYKLNQVKCKTYKNYIVIMVNKSESDFDLNFERICKVLVSIK
jgi:hypothetical protein